MNPFALRKRLKRVIERVGELYVSGGSSRAGVFVTLPRGTTSTYVDDGLVSDLPRPIHMAYVPWDDPSAVGATLLVNSRSLLVRAAVEVRLAGETVARLLVAA